MKIFISRHDKKMWQNWTVTSLKCHFEPQKNFMLIWYIELPVRTIERIKVFWLCRADQITLLLVVQFKNALSLVIRSSNTALFRLYLGEFSVMLAPMSLQHLNLIPVSNMQERCSAFCNPLYSGTFKDVRFSK